MAGSEEGEGTAVDLRLLRAAVEATGEAILITSAELNEPGPRIAYANPAFTLMTGYESHEVVGRTPRLLQGPRTERAVLDRMRAPLEAGERFQGEALNYRKDGSTYMVEWLITPVREAGSRITHWVSAQRDITDRRASEDRQAMLVRELHHRVKNTLATVQAVFNATARSGLPLAELTRAFSGRITFLARTHALINEDLAQAASFDGLLRAELEPYDTRGGSRSKVLGSYYPPNSRCRSVWRSTSSPPTPCGTGRSPTPPVGSTWHGGSRTERPGAACAGTGTSTTGRPSAIRSARVSAIAC
ncbi:MAG: PAS domain S-box protein [Methylobacterium frigidaeris]